MGLSHSSVPSVLATRFSLDKSTQTKYVLTKVREDSIWVTIA